VNKPYYICRHYNNSSPRYLLFETERFIQRMNGLDAGQVAFSFVEHWYLATRFKTEEQASAVLRQYLWLTEQNKTAFPPNTIVYIAQKAKEQDPYNDLQTIGEWTRLS